MKTLSISEAKMKLSALVDSIGVTDEEVVITKNGRPVAVLVSPDEFEGWREEIKRGLQTLKKKKASLYTLDELFE
jgi:prevent-host-death family protein